MVFHLPQRSRYQSVYWRWFLWWPCYDIFLVAGINHRPSRVYIIYFPCWHHHACFGYLFPRLCWWFTTVRRVWSRSEGDCERVLARLSSCTNVISEWMIQNTLHLNQDKTESFLIANRNFSAALSDISLKLGELSIQRSTSIKNLGVTFDDSLTMSGCILKSTLFVNLLIFT